MSAATRADLAMLVPELILTGMALLLILLARRTQALERLPLAGTLLAALGAGLAAVWIVPGAAATGFGGMIAADGYARFFLVVVAASLALAALLSDKSLHSERVSRGEYHALLLLASTGMMLAVASADLLTLYLALELMTLCSIILVGITVESAASNEAAIKYFLIASFASALLLFGISLTYGVTGATDFATISAALFEPGEPGAPRNPLLIAAMGLVAAGLAFKIAAVPFHAWAPDAYQGALAPVAAFLAAGSKAAGLAALGRVSLAAFGAEAPRLGLILAGLAALSVVVGTLLALAQTNLKRLLAYSSIAHVGYALLGLIAGTPEGASATMTYAFFYVFMTLGAFGVVIALGERGEQLDGYQGLAAQRPGAAALMLLFLLSLTGLPPTAGFVAKFAVIQSAVRADQVGLAVLAVVCSVVSAFLYMRIAVLMYMKEPQGAAPAYMPATVSAVLAVAALVTLVGGILPGSLMTWAVAP